MAYWFCSIFCPVVSAYFLWGLNAATLERVVQSDLLNDCTEFVLVNKPTGVLGPRAI